MREGLASFAWLRQCCWVLARYRKGGHELWRLREELSYLVCRPTLLNSDICGRDLHLQLLLTGIDALEPPKVRECAFLVSTTVSHNVSAWQYFFQFSSEPTNGTKIGLTTFVLHNRSCDCAPKKWLQARSSPTAARSSKFLLRIMMLAKKFCVEDLMQIVLRITVKLFGRVTIVFTRSGWRLIDREGERVWKRDDKCETDMIGANGDDGPIRTSRRLWFSVNLLYNKGYSSNLGT